MPLPFGAAGVGFFAHHHYEIEGPGYAMTIWRNKLLCRSEFAEISEMTINEIASFDAGVGRFATDFPGTTAALIPLTINLFDPACFDTWTATPTGATSWTEEPVGSTIWSETV